MAFQRWLAAIVACCGFLAACSSIGELDGDGGSGGTPTGQWDGLGGAAGGIGNAGGRGPGGAAGGIGDTGGRGGFRGPVSASELSCLKGLFAACPTDTGSCQYHPGIVGGGAGGNTHTFCYDGGSEVTSSTSIRQCGDASTGFDTEWAVYKPDGSLCYLISRTCECGCETQVITVRDGSGAVVGSGGIVNVAGSDARDAFTCVNGDSCEGNSCVPIVPQVPGGCVADGICP